MSSRDPALAEKIATHRSAIASMQERTDLLTGQLKRMASILTDDLVERFSSLIRAKLRDDDSTLRRNYVRLFVDKVIVANQSAEEANALKVVIQGSRSTLEGAAFAASASKTGKVPIFDVGMVPLARLERARLSTIDFESIASTIPPQGRDSPPKRQIERLLSRPLWRRLVPYAILSAKHRYRPEPARRRWAANAPASPKQSRQPRAPAGSPPPCPRG